LGRGHAEKIQIWKIKQGKRRNTKKKMKADNRKNLSNQQGGVTVWWFVAELTGAVLVVVDSVALHFHLVHLRKC
jgi:hypothetical protein